MSGFKDVFGAIKNMAKPTTDGSEYFNTAEDETLVSDTDGSEEEIQTSFFREEEPDERPVQPAPVIQKTPRKSAKDRTEKVVTVGGSLSRLLVVHAKSFDSAGEIVQRLEEGNTVILDLETTGLDEARRLADFFAGYMRGCGGGVTKISARMLALNRGGVIVETVVESIKNSAEYF